MKIEQEIASWNGKSSNDIEEIYNRHSDESSFISSLIVFLSQEYLQKGTSWLLKHHLNNKYRLDANEVATIYSLLPKLEHWEAKLHILQCIPNMPIGEAEKENVEIFLRDCLTDDNKFVRAWAYNGFYEIALKYSEYKDEANQLFEMAMKDEAPSVKARIRNIKKKETVK